jgi:hypothetical protein
MVVQSPKIQSICVLRENIRGIEAVIPLGTSRVGTSRELPKGAQLLVCGVGFDEHTVKVLWKQDYYFVYKKDLKP